MPRNPPRLPTRFPAGTKYILESRGRLKGMTLVHRYVQFPDGQQIELAARLVPACGAGLSVETKVPATRMRRSRTHSRASATAPAS